MNDMQDFGVEQSRRNPSVSLRLMSFNCRGCNCQVAEKLTLLGGGGGSNIRYRVVQQFINIVC